MTEGMRTDDLLKEQFNNLVQQSLKPYTTTITKARSFLSNIAYNSVNDQDILNRNFCFDTYVLVTKNLNLFSLERKSTTKASMKQIICFGKIACQMNCISLFVNKKTFAT